MAQTIIVDISTRGANPVAYTHQGDTGRTFFAEIYENGEAFAVAGYTIKVGAILPDDRGYYVIAGDEMVTATKTNDNTTNKIYFTLSDKYSLKAGNGILTLIFTSNTGTPSTIRPINIDLRIQKSADAPETIAGASDFVPVLQRYMAEDMQTYINAWLDAHPEAMQYYISGSKLVLDENGILSIQNDTDEIVEALDLDTLRAEVTDLKSDFNNIKRGLYTGTMPLNLVADTYISTTGAEVYYGGWSSTDFINVIPNHKVLIKSAARLTYNAFYDINKQFISGGTFTVNVGTVEIEIPSNAHFCRLSGSTSNMQNVVVYTETSADLANVNQEVNNIKIEIGDSSFSSLFELGNINISESGWTYLNSNSRVRTKEGIALPLKTGAVIGLSDYSDSRYYLGWKREDNTYGSAGWLTNDYVVTDNGEYVVLISNITEKAVSDPSDLSSLFFGAPLSTLMDNIDREITDLKADSAYYAKRYENIAIMSRFVDGYMNADGVILPPDQKKKKKTTDYISINGVDSLIIAQFGTPVQSSGTAVSFWLGASFFDEEKVFISRSSIFLGNGESAHYVLNQFPSGARYVRLSFRSGDDIVLAVAADLSFDINSFILSDEDYHYIFESIADTDKETQQSIIEINGNVKSVNHRGWYMTPENTLPAYKLSKEKGFRYVETDVEFTSDSVAVLLHDSTINRTARNSDGTEIENSININSITYEQALNYDFGIYKGNDYTGTKIPTFEEFVKLCRDLGLHPYIELKTGTEQQINGLVETVKKYGMSKNVTWISFYQNLLGYVKNMDNTAVLGFVCGAITSDIISSALALKTQNNHVFVDADYTNSDEEIQLCIDANLPLEVWTVDSANTISTLNPYISGVTSDNLLASVVLYEDNLT